MHTRILDPETTKVCSPTSALPVRFKSYPAPQSVIKAPDFAISAEQLARNDAWLNLEVALGTHIADAIVQLAVTGTTK